MDELNGLFNLTFKQMNDFYNLITQNGTSKIKFEDFSEMAIQIWKAQNFNEENKVMLTD